MVLSLRPGGRWETGKLISSFPDLCFLIFPRIKEIYGLPIPDTLKNLFLNESCNVAIVRNI